jgi:hypothetical protein
MSRDPKNILEHLQKRFQEGASNTEICFDSEITTVAKPDLIEVIRQLSAPKKRSSKRKKVKTKS